MINILQVHAIDMTANEQKEEWFLAINPNGRIPALTDKWTDGSEIRIFESGAILQYLVDRYDKDHKVSYPKDSKETWEVNSWVSSSGCPFFLIYYGTDCSDVAALPDGWPRSYAGTGKPL